MATRSITTRCPSYRRLDPPTKRQAPRQPAHDETCTHCQSLFVARLPTLNTGDLTDCIAPTIMSGSGYDAVVDVDDEVCQGSNSSKHLAPSSALALAFVFLPNTDAQSAGRSRSHRSSRRPRISHIHVHRPSFRPLQIPHLSRPPPSCHCLFLRPQPQ